MKNKQELDLIDRDWLSAECVRAILDPQEALDFLLARIKNAKPIDAVPVVRCRECKKRQDPRECPMCFTEVEDIEGGRMYKFTDLTRPDGFCHMGAKEE